MERSFAYPILIGLLLLISSPIKLCAQEPGYLEGIIVTEDSSLSDFLIKNKSNAQIVLTGSSGFFKIKANTGDSLVISHASLQDSTLVLDSLQLTAKPFIFEMKNNIIALDEVKIEHSPQITAESVGIIQKRGKKLTINEKRLNAAGDFKFIHLLGLLGGSLEVDPIINKISGRTNRLKKYIDLDRKIETMKLLKTRFYEYMHKDMRLSDEDIDVFLYYLSDRDSVHPILEEPNEDRAKFNLADHWYSFLAFRKEEEEISH